MFDDAIALTQPVLGADATADFREGVGGGGNLVGFLQPVFGDQLQPVGNVVGEWTVQLTVGDATL
jgi:hypothetical protein